MAKLTKIFKNKSGSPLEILGATIADDSQREAQANRWLEILDDSDLQAKITSGDIVVNDGTNDLGETEGLTHALAFEKMESSSTGVVGTVQTATFVENGTAINTWLKQEDANIPSNETPFVFKYKSRLVGINFSNKNRNPDPIVLVALSEYGNEADIDSSYKWTLPNVRTAVKTNQTSGFTVNPGDKMALYCYDNGGNSADVVITLDFIVIEASTTNIKENFSADFSYNDFPSLGTIPEIFT